MDLRQLRYFVAVFEYGNLSRAAEEIPISQPALTRSIKLLEDELGVQLFERHARGTSATQAAERFYHHAKSILAECVRARDDALYPDGRVSGEVRVGIGPLFATRLFGGILADLCAENTLLTVIASQDYFEDLVTMLSLGQIELAFCNFPVQELPQSLAFEPLFKVNTNIYVGSGNPLASATGVTKGSLIGEKWANVNRPHSLDVFNAFFVGDDLPTPHITTRTNSLTLIRSLVANHGFVGLLPEIMMLDEIDAGTVVRVDMSGTPIVRDAGLIVRRDGYQRPVVDLLADRIRTACRENLA